MRFKSKREFVESVEKEHQTFVELMRSIPSSRYRESEVWGDGWTIRDLLAHLTEWEQMSLGWSGGPERWAPHSSRAGVQVERNAQTEPGNLGRASF